MTRRAFWGRTNPYRAFETGCCTVTTRYSSSAMQAAIDHLRALGSSRDEIKVLAPDTVAWRGARWSLFPCSTPATSPRTCGLGCSLRLAHVPSRWSAGSRG